MWVRRWHVPAFSDQLRNLVQTWHPDIVQFEFHLMAQYAGSIRPAAVPLVLVQHEPGSSIARERCHYSGWLNRPIVLADYYAWRRYERRMLAGFDRVVTFTDRDGEAARTANAAVRTTTIPLGITIPPAPLSAGDGASILFIGSFVHAPNEDAAIRLATRILPLVRRRIPDATVTIVGSEPPPRVAALADASVRVHGSVDDVTPYLDRAAVFAAPLRFGGGMRVKILEALAAGKAVVCSPQAAEGLSVRHGVELKLAATDEEFADTIVELFDCPARRLALAGAARQWAEANAASRMCADAFRSLYDTLLAAPVAPPEPVSGTTVPIA
jgi:glycosyltransferase involved in cell wall biosynthesis